ncbi:hypothetical protein [uncultured Christiangramia sp.]|uniref:hypothetical protein n=1 Tax=uncultured Christiangramia sp. TaxID=503836 RepID=UPI00263804E1|nr:hypothetical protein [uncultured Christiangramia sp.]
MVTAKEILFGHKLSENVLKGPVQDFVDQVRKISFELNIVPDWLMAVIDLETGGTFDPSITNKLGYTGLIQFGKVAAKEVGTTTDDLRKMTAIRQLRYVYKYLKKYSGRMNSLQDVYLAVFFPAAIGKPDGWVLQTSRLEAQRIAKWNPLFDVNKDNRIQIWEIKKKLFNRIPTKYRWIA